MRTPPSKGGHLHSSTACTALAIPQCLRRSSPKYGVGRISTDLGTFWFRLQRLRAPRERRRFLLVMLSLEKLRTLCTIPKAASKVLHGSKVGIARVDFNSP